MQLASLRGHAKDDFATTPEKKPYLCCMIGNRIRTVRQQGIFKQKMAREIVTPIAEESHNDHARPESREQARGKRKGIVPPQRALRWSPFPCSSRAPPTTIPNASCVFSSSSSLIPTIRLSVNSLTLLLLRIALKLVFLVEATVVGAGGAGMVSVDRKMPFARRAAQARPASDGDL